MLDDYITSQKEELTKKFATWESWTAEEKTRISTNTSLRELLSFLESSIRGAWELREEPKVLAKGSWNPETGDVEFESITSTKE